MERKKLISRIDRAHTTPEQQAAIDHHIEQGYRITNMKETLLHSVVSFTSLEEGSYAVDKALKEKIGNRAKILFGYAISSGNECPICGNYFKWVLEDQLGIKDFDHFEFTDEEMELLDFAAAHLWRIREWILSFQSVWHLSQLMAYDFLPLSILVNTDLFFASNT